MTRRSRWTGFALFALGLAVLTNCRPDDQRTETVDPKGEETHAQLAPEVVAQLDSGMVAFREERIDDALRYYKRVTELDPALAAGWFGVYMAQHRLGNTLAADSALERARRSAPGASLIHPTPADALE